MFAQANRIGNDNGITEIVVLVMVMIVAMLIRIMIRTKRWDDVQSPLPSPLTCAQWRYRSTKASLWPGVTESTNDRNTCSSVTRPAEIKYRILCYSSRLGGGGDGLGFRTATCNAIGCIKPHSDATGCFKPYSDSIGNELNGYCQDRFATVPLALDA